MAAVTVVTGTIAAGASLSSTIDCTGGTVVLIGMPPAWTPANITFRASNDGTSFFDLFDPVGGESMLDCEPGRAVIVPTSIGAAVAFLQIRSGTHDSPVVQQGARTFTITLGK